MEGAKTGCAAESQISDNHGAAKKNNNSCLKRERWINTSSDMKSNQMVPVEGPFEQELACSFGEATAALVRLQDLRDHIVQPGSPLVQRALLLQGDLKILL